MPMWVLSCDARQSRSSVTVLTSMDKLLIVVPNELLGLFDANSVIKIFENKRNIRNIVRTGGSSIGDI